MAESSTNPLSWVDYVVMSVLMLILIAMGIYYGAPKRRPSTTRSFFLADRNIFSLPIALTLLASFMSPVTLLGNPAETYVYGTQYIVDMLERLPVVIIVAEVIVPVFYGLDITTSYQVQLWFEFTFIVMHTIKYLRRRYGLSMQLLGALIFFLQTAFYVAIVSFSPALVINAVTNLNLWIIIVTTGLVCTFYTTMGGMKAVIWTDVVLALVIGVTVILVIISCVVQAGGIVQVWEINKADGRTDFFTFPLDLTVRLTFCSVFFGTFINNLNLWGVSQTAVQRYLSAKSLRAAKMSMWLNFPFAILVTGAALFQGIALYAFYHTEDDSISPTVFCEDDQCTAPPPTYVHPPPNYTSPDQILMIYVNQQFAHIPGYQGLFISCIFAGALSTISSGLNAMVAVSMEDIWKPFRKWLAKRRNEELEENETRDTRISKILSEYLFKNAFVYGLFTIGLALLSTRLGTLVTLVNSIFGVFGGPVLSAFLLGMLWKRTIGRAVFIGTAISFAIGMWMVIGSFVTDGQDDVFYLYKISFLWYGVVTIIVNVFLSVILSEIFRCFDPKEREKKVDLSLLCTWLRPKSPDTKSTDDQLELKSEDDQPDLKSEDDQQDLKSEDDQQDLKSEDDQLDLKSEDDQQDLKSEDDQPDLKSEDDPPAYDEVTRL
ncbi:Sodium-coupled monocarboxylate transporter 1 [Holothuria leucospilota]|uniref:Sodium-coupled monocarboxylate transporter 1 n=1 Tax=Holothuria leucospilota TaxID=206669 RepID=A0A9Q1C2K9_HOLLE|nr:Sodium-coupled monocarboxylate transporter 1 [Holothuria leucospilota]